MSRTTLTDYPTAPVPERPTRTALEDAIHACRACDLYAHAIQPVLGEGPRKAHAMMVGEQPGDREDIEGHPFVGPAGRVLDRGLEQAGSLLGSSIRIGRDRGRPIDSELAELVTVTTHPSAILRFETPEQRDEALGEFVSDLRGVARWLAAR